jgi:two-component system heavy metal sensor histidine kinase CusS
MRPQSSLVKRLTLMFMFAVTAVLVVAGVAFYGSASTISDAG